MEHTWNKERKELLRTAHFRIAANGYPLARGILPLARVVARKSKSCQSDRCLVWGPPMAPWNKDLNLTALRVSVASRSEPLLTSAAKADGTTQRLHPGGTNRLVFSSPVRCS